LHVSSSKRSMLRRTSIVLRSSIMAVSSLGIHGKPSWEENESVLAEVPVYGTRMAALHEPRLGKNPAEAGFSPRSGLLPCPLAYQALPFRRSASLAHSSHAEAIFRSVSLSFGLAVFASRLHSSAYSLNLAGSCMNNPCDGGTWMINFHDHLKVPFELCMRVG